MYRILFIFLCTLFSFFSLNALQLKQEFLKAKSGDFLVFEQDRLITLMLIRSQENDILTLEEITITEKKWNSLQKNKPLSWKTWVANKAPKNGSWIVYDVNLISGQILKGFSYTNNCSIERNPEDNFLPVLLNLSFNQIPYEERKKVGMPPPSGEKDKRGLWNPPLFFEGQNIANVKFEGYRARWPKDSSPLSNSLIEIYLPVARPDLPSYFPYWLQVSDQFSKAKLHIIDSGSNLQSPFSGF